MKPAELPKTGWPPGLLQDDCKKLSKWLANQPGARHLVARYCQEIQEEKEDARIMKDAEYHHVI